MPEGLRRGPPRPARWTRRQPWRTPVVDRLPQRLHRGRRDAPRCERRREPGRQRWRHAAVHRQRARRRPTRPDGRLAPLLGSSAGVRHGGLMAADHGNDLRRRAASGRRRGHLASRPSARYAARRRRLSIAAPGGSTALDRAGRGGGGASHPARVTKVPLVLERPWSRRTRSRRAARSCASSPTSSRLHDPAHGHARPSSSHCQRGSSHTHVNSTSPSCEEPRSPTPCAPCSTASPAARRAPTPS